MRGITGGSGMDRDKPEFGTESWKIYQHWQLHKGQPAKNLPPLSEPSKSPEDQKKKASLVSQTGRLGPDGVFHLDINLNIASKELKRFEILGEGSYGVVY